MTQPIPTTPLDYGALYPATVKDAFAEGGSVIRPIPGASEEVGRLNKGDKIRISTKSHKVGLNTWFQVERDTPTGTLKGYVADTNSFDFDPKQPPVAEPEPTPEIPLVSWVLTSDELNQMLEHERTRHKAQLEQAAATGRIVAILEAAKARFDAAQKAATASEVVEVVGNVA